MVGHSAEASDRIQNDLVALNKTVRTFILQEHLERLAAITA